MDLLSVTAVIINYKTPDLTLRALATFKSAYPEVKTLLIDNGSGVEFADVMVTIRSSWPDVELTVNAKNLHHGPAMHQAMGLVATPWVLFLDSDCEVLKPGFIEVLVERCTEKRDSYAAGALFYLNKRGFLVPKDRRGAIPYIHPYCMLVKKELYEKLPPYELHGSPALRNMMAAAEKGYALVDVALEEYVRHDFRGTAGRFGYGLGFKGRVNYLLHRIGW
jgi:GT2 family glycosyltransferase